MKIINNILVYSILCLFMFSCNQQPATEEKKVVEVEKPLIMPSAINPDSILKIDLKRDLTNKPIQELRLMRGMILARYGHCFMEADLRGFFEANAKWYGERMYSNWEENCMNKQKELNSWVNLTPEEQVFVNKADSLINEKLKQNSSDRNGLNYSNIENIINLYQYKDLSPEFLKMLGQNNFAIVPGANIQLFHVYEENDYRQLPNFVTTDMYLQLFHMYFAYLLKSLEKEKLMPIASDLSNGLYDESMKIAKTSENKEVKDLSEYCAVFSAVPAFILNGHEKVIPESYAKEYENEISNINAESDAPSKYLNYEVNFPYTLFKPRGNYSRTEEMKKYFKAMIWLQIVPFCRDKEDEFKRAVFLAFLLNKGMVKDGTRLFDLYKSLFEPITFIIGEPDNMSIIDVANYLEQEGIKSPEDAISTKTLKKIDKFLVSIRDKRNKIKAKIETKCEDKINFMPQRYLLDNEILQELVDIKANAERAFPRGLDIFAVFENPVAEDILKNTYKDNQKWDKYDENLLKLKKKFANYDGWDKAMYNKWLQCLVTLTKNEKEYPGFMQAKEWGKKNLNTALASWAELKHDAILYAEQPMAAECGGGDMPPDPITVGYVEPNVKFWEKIVELIDLTDNMLKLNNLYTEDIEAKTKSIREQAEFLLSASQKELKKEKLSPQEYGTIEKIGSSTEYLTLSIIEPGVFLDNWSEVQGPDKSVAIVADIYTRNIQGCTKDGILHVATGKVNDIFVVVEIEGYLYLTKGAVLSYYEFPRQPNDRLTDEKWQEILNGKEAPQIPEWMFDIIFFGKDKPKVDEKVFYSSGC